MTRTMTRAPLAPRPKAKPQSNIYTVLLVVAFVFVVAAVVFNEVDLITRYGVEVSKTLWPF